MPNDSYQEKRAKWAKKLVDLLDVFESAYRRDGCSSEEAKHYAEIAVTELAFYFGGKNIYIPKGKELTVAMKHKRMWGAFDKGATMEEIATMFDMNVISVYRVIGQQRKLHRIPMIQAHATRKKEVK